VGFVFAGADNTSFGQISDAGGFLEGEGAVCWVIGPSPVFFDISGAKSAEIDISLLEYDLAVGNIDIRHRNIQFFGEHFQHLSFDVFGRILGGMTGHEGLPAGIGPQIHTEIRIARFQTHIFQTDPQSFGGDHGKGGVRSLTDFGRCRIDQSGAAVFRQFDDDSAVKGVRPVDRITGTGYKKSAGHTDPFSFGKFSFFGRPFGTIPDGFDAFFHAKAAHVQIVAGDIAGNHHVFHPQNDGVDIQLFGDHIELLFPAGAGYHTAVSPHGAAGRLVVVNPVSIVFHVGQFVGAAQQRTGIINRGDAETGVGAAVEIALVFEGQDRSVFFDAGGHGVGELVACPSVLKYLLPIIVHLDGFAGFYGQQTGREFQRIGGGLDAESGAHIRFDHADFADGQFQHHGQGTLNVMGHLGGTGEGEIAEMVVGGKAALGFDERSILALILECGGLDQIAFGKSRLDIAELRVDLGADVAWVFVV